MHIFNIIGNFQSFFDKKNVMYTFHLLKNVKKLSSRCILDSLILYIWMTCIDIPAIYPESLKKYNFCVFHSRDLLFGHNMTSALTLYTLNIKVISKVKAQRWWCHIRFIEILTSVKHFQNLLFWKHPRSIYTHTHTRTHARTHARTHTHTHW